MSGRRLIAAAVVSCAIVRGVAACVGDDPDVDPPPRGERGQPCNEGRCLAGLTCIDNLCVDLGADGSAEDSGTGVDVDLPDVDTSSGEPMRIFVTSTFHPANMGGLPGADAICTQAANAVGLQGQYVAVLSTRVTNAKDRFAVTGPIHLLDDTLVAASAAELFSGTLRAAIDVDQNGVKVPSGIVWTGTDFDGIADRSSSTMCGAWQSADAGLAEIGRTDRTDFGWISTSGDAAAPNAGCGSTCRLYCIGPKK